jgi:hypothetical protein
MCPHFDGKYNLKCNDWLTKFEIEELKEKVRTIGGHILSLLIRKMDSQLIKQEELVKKFAIDLT